MNENIKDQSPDNNPLSNQANNPSKDVIKKPEIINKWKDYGIQFILIFLAVTLSFFADNIREKIAEKKIARQNLEDFREDLFQHENQYTSFINSLPKGEKIYDSIVSIFYTKNENTELKVLSRLLLIGQQNMVITINMPTYEQLINSGGMRFIENKDLKDNIGEYKNRIDFLINYNNRMIDTQNNLAGEIGKIIDVHDFWNPRENSLNYTPDMQPFTLTKEQRKFIISYYKLYKIELLAVSMQIKSLSKINASIIKMIDKELGVEKL